MKNWKTYLIVCFVSFFSPTLLYGQEAKSQELTKLLNSGHFFRAKELHQQMNDTIIQEVKLYYKFKMSQFLNKEDSATIYLEKLFADYPDVFGKETVGMYGVLFDTYANLRNYEKGVYTYERMMKHLEENPWGIDEKELIYWKESTENRLLYLKQLVRQPPIELKRKKTTSFTKIEGDEQLFLEVKVNGIAKKTYLDTGCSFHYISTMKEAEEIGIKCDLFETNKGIINNTETAIKQATIDSIEVGNITLYNIPALILENNIIQNIPDSVKNNTETIVNVDSIYTNITNSVIGLPVMKLLGKILIDYEGKKITFPTSDSLLHPTEDPNLFLYNSYLYTHLKLNGRDFTGTLDIGDNGHITIDTLFYKKHQKDIPITPITNKEPYYAIMPHQIWNNIPYEIPYKPTIVFNDKRMNPPTDRSVMIYPLRPMFTSEYFDGVIGYGFLKRIGKEVLLDLDNMHLEALKPISSSGQENKTQELIDLLNKGEFSKLKELHQQIGDTISPELKLFYKFRMTQFLNKEDSTTIYLEKILTNYSDFFKNETINGYERLFDIYINLRNYEKGVYTYERMMRFLKENPYNMKEEELVEWKDKAKDQLCRLKLLINQPPIKLKRKKTKNFAKIEGNEKLLLEVKLNGIAKKAYFDTESDNYYVMNRKEAEAIGIKCNTSEISKKMKNEMETSINQITIDSIEVGNITLYNIPLTIFDNETVPAVLDSAKNSIQPDSTLTNSVMGLPMMKLIGKILIDYKRKKVTFPISDFQSHSSEEPNLFFHNSDLYTRLKLNGKDFTGTLSLGTYEYMTIDALFFDDYKDDTPIIPITKKIVFNNKQMQPPTESAVKVYPLHPIWPTEYFDGVIGYDFFRRIGKKVLLDFDRMRLEAIK